VPSPLNERLDPSGLETATFPLVRKGFDPAAVKSRLRAAAATIRDLQTELNLLRTASSKDERGDDKLEVHRIAEALGAEATRVLESAHQAAHDRAERADREAIAVRDEAIAAAAQTRNAAKVEADEIIERAKRDSETIVEDGRSHGRHMVAEAQTVRERMLGDLSRKRQSGRAQVEQLRAARDRLLDSLAVVQQNLDASMSDLVASVPEARAAAERAGMRIKDEPVPTADHMEAELEAARLVGHPLVQDLIDPGPEPTFDTGEVESLAQLDTLDGADDGRPELFDVEVEDKPEPEAELEPVAEDKPEPVPEPVVEEKQVPVPMAVTESELVTESEDGVEHLFAKLRSTTVDDTVAGPADPDSEPTDPDPDAEPEHVPDPPVDAARQRCVTDAARALKKVVVDEQGALLDGIRRTGIEALRELIEDEEGHTASYDDAVRPALTAYAEASVDPAVSVELPAALRQTHVIALEPIRHRLSAFVKRSDDGDEPDETEMTDAVRAVYRESRSRRVPEAVAAAVVALDAAIVIASAPSKVRWVVDPDGPCGPDCADNELAGEIEPGKPFPTGDLHPPVHVACTCRLVPVTS